MKYKICVEVMDVHIAKPIDAAFTEKENCKEPAW